VIDAAREVDHSVLTSVAVDGDKLRRELQAIVLVLAARNKESNRAIRN
jgi:hypothetical protein